VTLTFDLLTLKVVSESRVTWTTSVSVLVFLGLSFLDLDPIYATDRRQTASSLNVPAYEGRGHNKRNQSIPNKNTIHEKHVKNLG